MIQLGASIISSTIATVLLYPAERVKIQMQLNTVKDKKHKQIINHPKINNLTQERQKQNRQFQQQQLINPPKQTHQKLSHFQPSIINKQTHTIKSTILQVYQKHGWTGFYTGLQSLVIGNGLSYGVYFVLYQKCKNYLGFQPGSVVDTIKCSLIAGVGASIATNPFWVLQTKQTQQKGTIIQKGKQLIHNEGLMALWKGLSSSLILVSNPIIQFVIYQQLKKIIAVDKDSRLYDLIIFMIGAISKMISTLFTYPLTVIRTKQHISVQKKRWQKIVKDIIKSEGIKGLFKGIQPKLVQTVLNSALLLMLFQRIRQSLINYFMTTKP